MQTDCKEVLVVLWRNLEDHHNERGTATKDGPSLRFLWWAILDSNQRPLPCEGSALAN